MFIHYLALFPLFCQAIAHGIAIDNHETAITDDGNYGYGDAPEVVKGDCNECGLVNGTSVFSTVGRFDTPPVHFAGLQHQGTLPLSFSSCYYVTDLNGVSLTRGGSERHYYFGNFLDTRNIIMRISRDAGNPKSRSDEHGIVDEKTSFYMYDETGLWTLQNKGGFVGLCGVGLWMTLSPADDIVAFKAQVKCLHGKCAPCLTLDLKPDQIWGQVSGLMPEGVGMFGDVIRQRGVDKCYPMLFEPTDCPGSNP